MSGTKRCRRCQRVKPASDFYSRKTSVSSWCKRCEVAAASARQKAKRQYKRFKPIDLSKRDAFVAVLNAI